MRLVDRLDETAVAEVGTEEETPAGGIFFLFSALA